MAPENDSRASILLALEQKAEFLVAHQLDLLAQIEEHLRGVHHTMRRIERLRSARHRIGPELSNGERQQVLGGLSDELTEIDEHLVTQHQSCQMMQVIIQQMQARLTELRQVADQFEEDPETPDEGGSASV